MGPLLASAVYTEKEGDSCQNYIHQNALYRSYSVYGEYLLASVDL